MPSIREEVESRHGMWRGVVASARAYARRGVDTEVWRGEFIATAGDDGAERDMVEMFRAF